MRFDYMLYYDACFVGPLFFSLTALYALIYATSKLIRQAVKKELNEQNICIFLAFLLAGTFLVCLNGGRLINGGFMLIAEKEADAITIEGTITDVEDLGIFSFPELETEYGYSSSNGVLITVDGKHCMASTLGQFEIGDSVSVVYLPKSGYILSITGSEQ